jgi:hypothetical protein
MHTNERPRSKAPGYRSICKVFDCMRVHTPSLEEKTKQSFGVWTRLRIKDRCLSMRKRKQNKRKRSMIIEIVRSTKAKIRIESPYDCRDNITAAAIEKGVRP